MFTQLQIIFTGSPSLRGFSSFGFGYSRIVKTMKTPENCDFCLNLKPEIPDTEFAVLSISRGKPVKPYLGN